MFRSDVAWTTSGAVPAVYRRAESGLPPGERHSGRSPLKQIGLAGGFGYHSGMGSREGNSERETEARFTALLARASLFRALDPQERARVAARFVAVRYEAGQAVCLQGEPADRYLIVAAGELEVRSEDGVGPAAQRLGPGECVGEMSLFLGRSWSETVVAAGPAQLLALDRSELNRLLLQHPKLLEALSRILGRRIAAASRPAPVSRSTLVIGVGGAAELRGKTLTASALAGLLRAFSERPVLELGLESVSGSRAVPLPLLSKLAAESSEQIRAHVHATGSEHARLRLALARDSSDRACADALSAVLEKLGPRFRYAVLDLGPRVTLGAEVCDVLVQLVGEAESGERFSDRDSRVRVLRVLNLHNPGIAPIPVSHCEPFVIPLDPVLEGLETADQVRYLLAHPRSPASPPLRRLARKILGQTVGLALGGFGAFGIAPIGALRVLEEEGIPVDLVAGASLGSAVALAFAAGTLPEQMVEDAKRIGSMRSMLSALDFTLTRPGILAGDRLVSLFAPLFGDVLEFSQLSYPCRTVATDVESGERVVMDRGPLAVSFRASASAPMIWAPVEHGERALVDGALTDPVPVDVVHEMGADICIAVQVVPLPERGVSSLITRISRTLGRLNPLSYLGGSRELPVTLDLVMNSIQILQHELGSFQAGSADVRIAPDLSGISWMEFDRAAELIESTAEATRNALGEIREALALRGVVGPQT